jgi:hypothetical protein
MVTTIDELKERNSRVSLNLHWEIPRQIVEPKQELPWARPHVVETITHRSSVLRRVASPAPAA